MYKMKKQIYLTVSLAFCSAFLSPAQDMMVVKMNEQADCMFTVYDISAVTFREPEEIPNVSLSCPNANHPHLIDMGLPSGTKWKCCNVGAYRPEDRGNYYAWGETKEKDCYSWGYYKHCDGGGYGAMYACHYIGNDIAGDWHYDVASFRQSPGCMPSESQFMELLNNCTQKWITLNGKNGMLFTGPNGSTIFLPAAGCRYDYSWHGEGSLGYYWSSSLSPYYDYSAYGLNFNSNGCVWLYYYRCDGFSIRAVDLP